MSEQATIKQADAAKRWLSIQALADRWDVDYDTIRREAIAGKIPSLKVGAQRRISRELAHNDDAAERSAADLAVDYFPAFEAHVANWERGRLSRFRSSSLASLSAAVAAGGGR